MRRPLPELVTDFKEVPVSLVLLHNFQKDLEEPAASELLSGGRVGNNSGAFFYLNVKAPSRR